MCSSVHHFSYYGFHVELGALALDQVTLKIRIEIRPPHEDFPTYFGSREWVNRRVYPRTKSPF
jgi:hypothetical protein